ncbi:MAG TPA: SH3 domain-containing protein [bacterium]|nr:SH3 domain-containing protein [bacterium]
MKARLVALVSLFSLLLLVAAPALAKRQSVAAKATATVRADADDGADSVATVKKGDMLTILGSKGDWTNVQTKDGTQGWVKSSVVSEKKASFDSMGTSSTTVAAAEGSTEGAIRGKGVKRKTVVVGTGGLPIDVVKSVATRLGKIPQVTVVDQQAQKKAAEGSPAGGVDGAGKSAAAKKGDLVVALAAGENQSLLYEIVDLKKKAVIGSGTAAGADELGTAVEKALLAAPAAASPTATSAGAAATATPAAAATSAAQ